MSRSGSVRQPLLFRLLFAPEDHASADQSRANQAHHSRFRSRCAEEGEVGIDVVGSVSILGVEGAALQNAFFVGLSSHGIGNQAEAARGSEIELARSAASVDPINGGRIACVVPTEDVVQRGNLESYTG